MTELTFFRQARHDGGIRMGIELDRRITLLEDSQPGPPESEQDPLGSALLWYVDIRCRGSDLPREAEAARNWFLTNLSRLQEGLEEFAEELRAGIDDDAPVSLSKSPEDLDVNGSQDLVIEYVCSSVRRVKSHELADTVLDVSHHLMEYLNRLSAGVSLV
jgi:hypothetical protein